MNKVNFPKLLLALLVISLFSGIGIAIAYRNVWLILLFIILGFGTMGYGISLKKSDS